MEAALRWLAERTRASAELLGLMDATPIGCGQSTTTTPRSDLFGWAGYGFESAHSRWYLGQLLLITTADGTSPGSAWPTHTVRRARADAAVADRPARSRAARWVTDKGLSGRDTEQFFADLDLLLVQVGRRDEKQPRPMRQRIRGDQLDTDKPTQPATLASWPACEPAQSSASLALNAAIWHNWTIDAPVKRSRSPTTNDQPQTPGRRSRVGSAGL
jgi:hypothetical protein